MVKKLKISVLTGILIALVIFSSYLAYSNIKSGNSRYEECKDIFDSYISAETNTEFMSEGALLTSCRSEADDYFNMFLGFSGLTFILAMITILSWKVDSLPRSVKKK